MSWIGGSLSSLTGQLSNLTKDILTEGTEEVGDPQTELRLAKERIQQLDSLLSTQRQENERLQRINKELEEKAESAELQINTISRQYRGVLESKEKEVNALKQQHQELLEQHARTAALSLSSHEVAPSSPTSGGHSQASQGGSGQSQSHSWASPALGGQDFASFNYDGDPGDWDFDDSIRLQRENNNLRVELQRLQSEIKHWRSVAGQLGKKDGQKTDEPSVGEDVLDLKNKVKSLEAQLAKKTEELQQQATSLHEHHRQKLSALKLQHKTEVDSLHEQLSALEQQIADAGDGTGGSQHSGSGTLPESDRSDASHKEVELQKRLTDALHEKDKAQNARQHLEGVLEELQQEVQLLQQKQEQQWLPEDEVQNSQDKLTALTQRLQESEERQSSLEKENREMREELVRAKHRLLDQLDANHADAQDVLSELRELRENINVDAAYRRHEMRAERRTLVNQLFRVGQQKSQLTQSLQSVIEEKEEAVARTETVVDNIGDKEQQKLTAELFDTLQKENILLKEEKLKLEEQILLLEKAANTYSEERQNLQRKVTTLKSQLRSYTGEEGDDSEDTFADDLSSGLSSGLSNSKNAAVYVGEEEVERELASLRAQLQRQKEDSSDVEMERTDWLMEREALEDVITELREKSQKQEEEIQSLKSGSAVSIGPSSNIVSETSSSENLHALEEELSSLKEEKSELENALEELDQQHSLALEQLIKQRDQLASQLSDQSSVIQQQKQQIDKLNNELVEMRESGGVELHDDTDGGGKWTELEEKCRYLENELAEMKKSKGKDGGALEKEIVELKEKLHKGGLVINDLHMDKQELESELKSAKEETAAKVAKLKEMREENTKLGKDKKDLEDKLAEMEDRLSEMEEEVERWQQVNEEKQVQQMSAVKEHNELTEVKARLAAVEEERNIQQMSAAKEHKELDDMKAKLAAVEAEKQNFRTNFEHMTADHATIEFPFEDPAFLKVLEEEAKVRKQIEADSQLIRDLKTQVQQLYEDKQRLKSEVQELRRNQDTGLGQSEELSKQLQIAKSELESLRQEKSQIESQLEKGKEESQELRLKLSEAEAKLVEAGKQNEELSDEFSLLQQEKENLQTQLESQQKHYDTYIQELKAGQELGAESLQAEHQKLLDCQKELSMEIDRLKSQVKDKAEVEQKLEAKKQETDALNARITSFKEEVASIRGEITRLEGLCEKKDEEIEELKHRMAQFDSDLAEIEESVNTAEEKHSLELSGKEEALQELRARNMGLERSLSQIQVELESVTGGKKGSDELDSKNSGDMEKSSSGNDIEQLQKEIQRLKNELSDEKNAQEAVSQLEVELSLCNETIAKLRQDLSAAQEVIRCHEAGITELNEKSVEQRRTLEQAQSDVTRQQSTIAVLRQSSVDKETVISQIESKINFLVTILTPPQIEQLKNFSQNPVNLPALPYKEREAIEYSDESQVQDSGIVEVEESQQSQVLYSASQTGSEVNGYVVDEDFDSSTSDRDRFIALEKEMEELRERLREKDTIVTELQKSNSSLLGLLEKGGGGGMNKDMSSQVATHKLEAELRNLRGEKEQMMAVVTEKSRENSSLKNEVHRLMEVVSAGQAALSKLQEDNRTLEQRQHSPPRDEEDDMRREALSNMARLVRDRETEIEALKQKNETLLAVLQESGESQAAAHLAPLLKEKESLTQQIAAFSAEREQLIACVTQKHSESLAYHAESQRLTALLSEAQESCEKAKKDYAALIPAFEDKSQALIAAQKELVKCKQKVSDLEVHYGELIQRSNSQDSPNSPELTSLEEELRRLRDDNMDMRSSLSDRDEKIQSLTHRINSLEEELASKETECTHLRKQAEHSKFQLTGLMAEIADVKAEKEQIQQRTSAQDTQSASLRESYNKLSLEARDKDVEVASLKEQVTTLTSLLNEQQGEQGQVSRLMKDNEAALASARYLQQERDQQAMLAEQRLHESNALRTEIAHLKDKEFKLNRELERLRQHLIEIEDGYTKEALESEEREKELRNRLAVAEEQVMSSSSRVEMASKESSRQIESLKQEVHQLASQRDSAYMQVANTQEQCQQYATSLSNLQLVLEHFQKEKDSAIAAETEHLHNECKVLKIEIKELQAELEATRGDLTEALDGLEAASRLSEQLDRKEEAMVALKEEVQLREQALNEAEEQIRKLNSSTEAKVDKTLMHNMVMTWLTSPENKRMEIVQLIGNILSFSSEDFQKISAAQGKGGLLSGIFHRSSTSSSPHSSPARNPSDQSFSQLFVKFLEKESSPPPTPVRLPAEAMAAETQHRHKPAFNPFTAPRHVTHDGQRSTTPTSHILMTPDSPAPAPLFTPFTSTSNASESAILKDVLGKR